MGAPQEKQGGQNAAIQPSNKDKPAKRVVWVGNTAIPRGLADTLYQKGQLSKGSISLNPPES